MKTLHVIVANKIATYSYRGGDIVCGNSDYQIEFTFDGEWDAYPTKTVRFIWNGKYVDVTRTNNNIFPVPIVTNTDKLEIGVYAGDLSTTTSALISCRKSVLCNSEIKSEGTVVIPDSTPVLVAKTFNANGTYTPDSTCDGFSKVTVAVPSQTVEVIPDGYIKPTGTRKITANGTYDVKNYANVNVAVTSEAPKLCGTEVTPTKDYQNIVPEGDYIGFDEVIVKPIPDEYEIVEEYEGAVTIASAVSRITFTIDGTSYEAEEGMTWGEWVESEYNTGTFIYSTLYNHIADDEATQESYVTSDNDSTGKVAASDTIIADHAYSIYEVNHSGGSN